jgi:asparagine synthase (glutamine-hydrolysing)
MVQSPVQTFSIGFQEKKYSELPFAAEVARHFGTVHTEHIVTPEAVRDLDELVRFYDEPFADASAIPSMAVARVASKHVKVVLSGDGGDEGFGGYNRYSHDLTEAAIRAMLPQWFCQHVLRPVATLWPKADWLPRPLRLKSLLQNLSTNPAAAYANTLSACRLELRGRLLNPAFASLLQDHRPEAAVEHAYRAGARDALSGMLAADTEIMLPDDFLTKVDRASMAFGLEVRPPLLDVSLLELAAKMPSSMKIRNGSRKWILKQIYEPKLPPGLAHRRKQGFELPVDEWLRGPLQSQFQDVVLQESASIADYVDIAEARRMYDQHCSHRGQYGQVLWSLLVLGRWLQMWGRPQEECSGAVRNQVCEVAVG